MEKVNMHEAKIRLSSLVDQALAGKEIVIAKAGMPLVRLVPIVRGVDNRVPGRFKGKVRIAPDFDQVPKDVVRVFEGG